MPKIELDIDLSYITDTELVVCVFGTITFGDIDAEVGVELPPAYHQFIGVQLLTHRFRAIFSSKSHRPQYTKSIFRVHSRLHWEGVLIVKTKRLKMAIYVLIKTTECCLTQIATDYCCVALRAFYCVRIADFH